jgi:hypothetical protein
MAVPLQEKSDAFGELAQAIHFGDDCVHSDFFRASVVHGVEKNRNLGRQLLEFSRGSYAAHPRHGKVENNEVGPALPDAADGLASVRSFLERFRASVFRQEFLKDTTKNIAVVHDEDRVGHGVIWPENGGSQELSPRRAP